MVGQPIELNFPWRKLQIWAPEEYGSTFQKWTFVLDERGELIQFYSANPEDSPDAIADALGEYLYPWVDKPWLDDHYDRQIRPQVLERLTKNRPSKAA